MSASQSHAELPNYIIEFKLEDNRYCVGLPEIAEIVEPKSIKSVPSTPTHVSGVMDLRGQTTTIINPKSMIGVNETDSGEYVIIFDVPDTEEGQIGWLVDRVDQVTELSDPDVKPVEDSQSITATLHDENERFILWVNHTHINSVISAAESSQLEAGGSLASPLTEEPPSS